jgi:ABC-type dipeptide/oligopeptide/nickel transport system permease subunit
MTPIDHAKALFPTDIPNRPRDFAGLVEKYGSGDPVHLRNYDHHLKILAFIAFGNRFSEPISPSQMSFLFGLVSINMFDWTTIARVIRGNILTVKNFVYALAAQTIGAKNPRILFRHLVPNAILPLLVIATMNIGTFVLTFASLSFLGLGMPEGYADWGQMLSVARNWPPSLSEYFYIVIYPGIAILLFVLAWDLVGDPLRDVLDPRLRSTVAEME